MTFGVKERILIHTYINLDQMTCIFIYILDLIY